MKTATNKTKFIFVTGGVVSSLGKGTIAASIARLLKNSKNKVFLQKIDPYLNVDPGTISPAQHGEVFVTQDGAETDLDIGHYERMTNVELNKYSNITAGKIYSRLIEDERQGKFLGQTVQVIPHLSSSIVNAILGTVEKKDYDYMIVEIGGTVGDIELDPFIEALREIGLLLDKKQVLYIHTVLLPYLPITKELKTKPAQHSTRTLNQQGIHPNFIMCRSSVPIEKELLSKIAFFCNIKKENVFACEDAKSIYHVPLFLENQDIMLKIYNHFKVRKPVAEFKDFNNIISFIDNDKTKKIKIVLVGKYTESSDTYLSICESIKHSGFAAEVNVELKMVNSDSINEENIGEIISSHYGVIIPGGFGDRGIDGKIIAIKHCRENNIPILGICLGMQLMAVEFARNVLNLKNANSTEFDAHTQYPIINILEECDDKKVGHGGTLRLGNFNCEIKSDTQAFKIYNNNNITERHRHRYEFNNDFREQFEDNGLVCSGINTENQLVEILELPKNNFFIGCQFHPEFKSRPNTPSPLFYGLIEIVKKQNHLKE